MGDAAAPFSLGRASIEARGQALDCLTSAVYYEAGQESDEGQRAVAQVILNRVRHPAFPNSVCGVVYQGSTRATGVCWAITSDRKMPHGVVWRSRHGSARACTAYQSRTRRCRTGSCGPGMGAQT